MRSRWERVTLPFIGHLIILYYGGPRVNEDTTSKYFVDCPYILMKRSAYESVGGHNRVAGEILEDIGLARTLKWEGFKVRALYGAGAFKTRIYRN